MAVAMICGAWVGTPVGSATALAAPAAAVMGNATDQMMLCGAMGWFARKKTDASPGNRIQFFFNKPGLDEDVLDEDPLSPMKIITSVIDYQRTYPPSARHFPSFLKVLVSLLFFYPSSDVLRCMSFHLMPCHPPTLILISIIPYQSSPPHRHDRGTVLPGLSRDELEIGNRNGWKIQSGE